MNKQNRQEKYEQIRQNCMFITKAKDDTLHALIELGKKMGPFRYLMIAVLFVFLFVYHASFHLCVQMKMREKMARVLAGAMSVIMVISSIQIPSFASNAIQKAAVDDAKEVLVYEIAGFESLEESVAIQYLEEGEEESAISFPDSLEVTVTYEVEKETVEETTEEIVTEVETTEEETVTEEVTTETTSTEEVSSTEGTTEDIPAETSSTEVTAKEEGIQDEEPQEEQNEEVVEEPEVQDDEEPQEEEQEEQNEEVEDEPEAQNEEEEQEEEPEAPAEDENVDSAKLSVLHTAVVKMAPLYTEADALTVNTLTKTNTTVVTEEHTIPVTWELTGDNAFDSSADRVVSEYIYKAVIPEEYVLADSVSVPTITVVIDKGLQVIDNVHILIEEPTVDGKPQEQYIDENGQYLAIFNWYSEEKNAEDETEEGQEAEEKLPVTFFEEKAYSVDIELTANEGYSLEGLTSESIIIEDTKGRIHEGIYDEITHTITIVFDTLEPAAFEESVTVDGVVITVSAPEGVLPKGAALKVEAITDKEELIDLFRAAEKADGSEEKSEEEAEEAIEEGFYAFDIMILNEDGEEVQPNESKGSVSVIFSNPDPEQFETSDLSVYHMDEESGMAENLDAQADENAEEVEAKTDSFSPFILLASGNGVTLHTGGGDISSSSWNKVKLGKYESNGSVSSFPTPSMADDTLQFAGWYTTATYSTQVTSPSSGKSYYAKWNRISKSASASFMKYEYKDGYSSGINAVGIMGGEEIRTTFVNGGYALYYTLNSTSPSTKGKKMRISVPGDPYVNISGTNLYVAQVASFEEPFVRYSYYVWNKGNSAVNGFNLAAVADVQIGDDDYADVTMGNEDGNKFVTMSDGEHEFRLYYEGDGITKTSTIWTGRYGKREENMYVNNPANQSGIDSAIAFSWKNKTIAANSVEQFTVLLGCGEPGSLVLVRKYGYDMDGNGSIDADEYVQVLEDDIIYAPEAQQKDGYYFLGWNTAENGSGRNYQPGDVVVLDGDISLYAQWKDIENTADITITLDGQGWDGQTVELYQESAKKYLLTDKGNGLYRSDKVINGTYDIYVNGRKSDQTIVFNATTTAIRKTQTVTYKLLHITTNLENAPSAAPGVVTLRTGSDVIYTPTQTAIEGCYTEYILTSDDEAYDIYVNNRDTGFEISVSEYTRVIDYYTVSVRITDDKPWTDALVELRTGSEELHAVFEYESTNGNTTVYSQIVQKDETGSYHVWVGGIDTHKIIEGPTQACGVDISYYTATVNIIGGLKNATIVMTNGVENYAFTSALKGADKDVYQVEHVLINHMKNGEEAVYHVTIKEVADATSYQIHSNEKELTLTYWRVDFYKSPKVENMAPVHTTYVLEGAKLPFYYADMVRLQGYGFDFWSENAWVEPDPDWTTEEIPQPNTPFDFETIIHQNYQLYANYTVPLVEIGDLIKTDNDGNINGGGISYRMANLTITGFAPTEESIKYVFLSTTNTSKIKILDTAGITVLNGEANVTETAENGFEPVRDKIAIEFSPMVSMAKAQDFLREKVVVTPALGETHTMEVEVADASGKYIAANSVDASQATVTATELKGSSGGVSLSGGAYYLKENATYGSSSNWGTSGLSISSGATVYIYIPENVTLTACGGNASGQAGAGAGIRVPSGSTLVLMGKGTVNAYGGNAANGCAGKSGEAGKIVFPENKDNYYVGGTSGAGGAGGGGAGAGIGGNGGNGGNGGTAVSGATMEHDSNPSLTQHGGYSGNSGYSGNAGGDCGTVYILDDLKINAYGGAGGTSGGDAGGYMRTETSSDSFGNITHHIAGSGGGGGGGGAGYPAYAIGSGGGGGGGGASGGSGGGDYSDSKSDPFITTEANGTCRGGSGAGGYGYNGYNGSVGTYARDTGKASNDKWEMTGGVGGSPGGSGGGSRSGSTTLCSIAGGVTINTTDVQNKKTSTEVSYATGYNVSFVTPTETSQDPTAITYYFGKENIIKLPEYEDTNSNVYFLGWQVEKWAVSPVSASEAPLTAKDLTRYPEGAEITLHPSTSGNIVFTAVTETIGGIRDEDNTNTTIVAGGSADIYYIYKVQVTVDGKVDKGRGNIWIGDKSVAPGSDGTYTLISTTEESRAIKIGGVDVGVNVTPTALDASADPTVVAYKTLDVTVTGKSPAKVELRGDGAPVLRVKDNSTKTSTEYNYTYECLANNASRPDDGFSIYVDGEDVGRKVSYSKPVTVPYHTTTVNLTAPGNGLDAISAVELRDNSGNALFMQKKSDNVYTYTKLEENVEYTVYINGEKTEYTTDFSQDKTLYITFARYTTVVETYLDGELFDKGTVRLDGKEMIRSTKGVYELTTSANEAMALSVDGKDVNMSVTPGTTQVVNYYTITYAVSGEEGSKEDVARLPEDNTNYLSGTNVTISGKGILVNGGKNFGGWKIGNQIYQPGESMVISGKTTAQAVWKPTPLTKAEEYFAVSLSSTEYTYNGEKQIPAITVTRGVTTLTPDVDYRLTYENSNKNGNDYVEDGRDTNATNAGQVTVTVTGIGDYSGELSASYTILPKSIKVGGLKAEDREYNGTTAVNISAADAELIGVVDGDDVRLNADSVGYTYSPDARDNKAVRVGAAQITGDEASNYEVEPVGTLLVNITRKPLTEEMFTVGNVTYNATAQTPTVTASHKVTINGNETELINESDYALSYENNIHAGEAKVIVNADIGEDYGDGNFIYSSNFSGQIELTFSINPAPITITALDASSVYGADIANLEDKFTTSPAIFTEEDKQDLAIKPVTTVKKGYNAGVYSSAVSISYNTKNKDYKITTIKADYTVTEAGKPEVTAVGYAGVYDGNSHGITVKPVGFDSNEEFDIYYSATALDETNFETKGSVVPLTYTDASSEAYTIYYYVDSENYQGVSGSQTVTIGTAPLTVTATDKTLTYGDDLAAINDENLTPVNGLKGVILQGLVEADKNENISSTVSYSSNDYSQYKGVGIYTVTPSLSNTDTDNVLKNYHITYVAGKLTVEPKEVSVTWPATTSYTYTGNVIHQEAVIEGLAVCDTGKVSISGYNGTTDAIEVGTYTASVSGITGSKASNYVMTDASEYRWEITQAENKWTLGPKAEGWITGASYQTPIAAAEFGTDKIVYMYKEATAGDDAYTETVPTQKGNYTLLAEIAATDNYTGLKETKDFSIVDAPTGENNSEKEIIYVYPKEEISITYGEALDGKISAVYKDAQGNTLNTLASTFTVLTTDLTAEVEYTTEYNPGDSVGSYVIVPNVTSEDYNIVCMPGTFEVTAKPIELTWSKTALKYTGEVQSVTATILENSKVKEADNVYVETYVNEGNVTNTAKEVGSYIAKAATLGGTNSNNYFLSDTNSNGSIAWNIENTTNEFFIQPSIGDWYYGDAPATPVATAKFGEVVYEYQMVKEGVLDWAIFNPKTADIPTDAGEYRLIASVEAGAGYAAIKSNTTTFSILPAEVVITAQNASGRYGEELQTLYCNVNALKGKINEKDKEDLNIGLATEVNATTPVGVYPIEVTFKANDNIKVSFVNGTYTISEAAMTATCEAMDAEDTLTNSEVIAEYDGKKHGITITAVNGQGAEIADADVYYYEESLDEATYGKGFMEPLTFTEVGEHTVYYYIVADNYTSLGGSAKVTITKRTVTVTAKDASIVYGEAPVSNGVTFEGFVSGEDEETLGLNVSYSYTAWAENGTGSAYTPGSNAGTYAIIPQIDSVKNYNFQYVPGVLTVNKKELTGEMFTVSAQNLIYNGEAKTPDTIVGSDKTGADSSVELMSAQDYDVSYRNNVNAGDEAVAVITAKDDGNYTGSVEKNFSIAPLAVEITAKPGTSKYNEAIPELEWHITAGELIGEDADSLAIEAVTSVKKKYAVGTYKKAVTISYKENSNYTVNTVPADYTVTPATLTVTAQGYSGVYDAEEHGVEIKAKTGEFLKSADIYYSREQSLTAVNYTSGDTISPTFTDAGSYTVYYYVTCENYAPVAGEISVEIEKAPLTVIVPDKEIVYGENPNWSEVTKDTFDYDGFIENDTVSSSIKDSNAINISAQYQQFDNVGTYSITANGLESDNYKMIYQPGRLTVTRKAVSFSWPEEDSRHFTYNGNEQGITANVTGTVNGDVVLVGSYTANTATSAGEYMATVKSLAGTKVGNYTFDVAGETTSCAWNINKAENDWVITPIIQDWMYQSTPSNPIASAKYGKATFSYSIEENGTYTDSIPNDAVAGIYWLKATVAETVNYKGLEKKISFEIKETSATANQIIYVTADDVEVTYGDPVPTDFTYTLKNSNGETVENVVSGTVNFVTDYNCGSRSGKYTVLPSGLTADAGYELVYVPGTITVKAKEISLVWSESAFTYSGETRTVTATVDSSKLFGEDYITVTGYERNGTATNYAIDAGTYTAKAIAFEGKNLSNYIIKDDSLSKEWTISKAEAGDADADNAFVVTPSIEGWTYGEDASRPAGEAKYGEVRFLYSTEENGEYSDVLPVNAGTYYMKAYVAGTSNYAGLESTAQPFVIAPSKVTIIVNDCNSKKGEDIAELAYTLSGRIKNIDDLGITLNTTATKTSLAGEYPITVSYTENANYEVTTVNGMYFITQDVTDVQLTALGYAGVYDGKAHGISVTALDADGKETSDATVYYSETELNNTNYGSGSLKSPTLTEVGTKKVYYYVAVENGRALYGSKDIIIDKKEVRVTANNATIVYGEAPTHNGVVYSGFVGTDSAESLGLMPTITIAYEQYGNIGRYSITPALEDTQNYTFKELAGTLRVTEKPVTFTWRYDSYVYDGMEKTVAAEVRGLVNNDVVSVSASGYELVKGESPAVNVGEYTTKVVALLGEKASNYIIEEDEATSYFDWEITEGINYFKTAPTIDSWMYGQEPSEPKAEVAYGDNGEIVFLYSTSRNGAYTNQKPTEVGTYYMKARMAATEDYSETESMPITFQIKKSEITITANTIFAKPGEEVKDLTYFVTGTVAEGEEIAVELSIDAETGHYDENGCLKAGSYDILVDVTSPNNNYAISVVNGVYHVTSQEMDYEISAEGVNTPYDGMYHGIKVRVETATGETPDDVTVYYSTSPIEDTDNIANNSNAMEESPTRKTVGTTTVYYYIVDSSINSVLTGACDITITKKPLTVMANPHTIREGDEPENRGVIYDGFIAGEDESYLKGTLSYSYSYRVGDPYGSYTITPSGLKSESYEIMYVSGLMTVEPRQKETKITGIIAQSITYNGQKHIGFSGTPVAGDGAVNEFVYTYKDSGENVIGIGLENAPKDAGSYKVVISVPSDNEYFKGSIEIPFSIAKRTLTIKATNQAMFVGAVFKAAEPTYMEFVGEDSKDDAFTTVPEINVYSNGTKVTDVTALEAGKYELKVEGSPVLTTEIQKNYTIGDFVSGTLTIMKVVADAGQDESQTGGTPEGEGGSSVDLTPGSDSDGGVVKTAVIKEDKAPDAQLEANLTVGKAEALLDVEEKKKVKEGKNALVYLLWDTVEENVYIAEKDSIEQKASELETQVDGNVEVGIFLDVSLFKVVGEEAPVKITNVEKTKVTIEVSVPDNLINNDSSIKRTYYVIYEHEGSVEVINPVFSESKGTLSFATDKFSVYSIAYSDVEIGSEGGNTGGGSSGGSTGGGSSDSSDDDHDNDDDDDDSSTVTPPQTNVPDAEITDPTMQQPENAGGSSNQPSGKPVSGDSDKDSTDEDDNSDVLNKEDGAKDKGDSPVSNEGDEKASKEEEKVTPPGTTPQAQVTIPKDVDKETQKQLEEALEKIKELVPGIEVGPFITIPPIANGDGGSGSAGNDGGATGGNDNGISALPGGMETVINPDGTVQFTFEVPEELQKEGRTFYLMSVDEDGNVIVLTNESIVDGMLTFTGDPDAVYQIIYEDEGVALADMLSEDGKLLDEKGEPMTVSTNHCYFHWIVLVLALAGILLALLLRKGRKVRLLVTGADMILMIVFTILGWCIWDILITICATIAMLLVDYQKSKKVGQKDGIYE